MENGRGNVRSFFFPLYFSHYGTTLYYKPPTSIQLALYALFFRNTYPHTPTAVHCWCTKISLSLSLSRVLVNAIKESCFASCSLYLATRPAETCPMRLWCNRGNRMSEEFRRRINPPTNQTRAERLIARGARTAAWGERRRCTKQ